MFGLPDLKTAQGGDVCIMGRGLWKGEETGSSPARISAFSRYFLGDGLHSNLEENTIVTVPNNRYVKIYEDGSDFFYLAEVRAEERTLFIWKISTEGSLIPYSEADNEERAPIQISFHTFDISDNMIELDDFILNVTLSDDGSEWNITYTRK
jgi:hypothetical protein